MQNNIKTQGSTAKVLTKMAGNNMQMWESFNQRCLG
jgi:hypothetical protein